MKAYRDDRQLNDLNKENHEPLKRIAQFIQERQHNDTQTLWLPAIWNTCGYQHIIEQKGGEILVPAFHFLHADLSIICRCCELQTYGYN